LESSAQFVWESYNTLRNITKYPYRGVLSDGRSNFAEAEVLPTGGRYGPEALRVTAQPGDGGEWHVMEIEPFAGE
jgi:hypothetical protein